MVTPTRLHATGIPSSQRNSLPTVSPDLQRADDTELIRTVAISLTPYLIQLCKCQTRGLTHAKQVAPGLNHLPRLTTKCLNTFGVYPLGPPGGHKEGLGESSEMIDVLQHFDFPKLLSTFLQCASRSKISALFRMSTKYQTHAQPGILPG